MREESSARLNYQSEDKTNCIKMFTRGHANKVVQDWTSFIAYVLSKSRRYPVSVGEQLSNIFKCHLDDDELTRVVPSGCRLVDDALLAGLEGI